MSKLIQDAIFSVESSKREINKLFLGTELSNSLLELNGGYDRILTRLRFMGGTLESDAINNTKHDFQPITNFMGEEIKIPKRVTAADLNPPEDAKQRYLAKVNKLYKEIGGIPADSILNSFTMPDDILVLRGVAKRAGVVDYETRELDTAFINDIIDAIVEKQAEADTQHQINEATAVKETKTVLTKEMIDADIELQEAKAKPGDVLIIYASGKKSLKNAKTKVIHPLTADA